ncbi:glycosyltransferase family 4 protein [Bacillus sp. FJAT-29790]|uniref:glycosyltransferase family 4 protein n=1 Tax=Bacillus sp. FJAT-29790 TaxID=1895002 RepID=UPI001C228DC0|nr:glycosyltransferase family 4 protein [Bacillus sp. FJAT-29790]MBU8880778.1 glycosyltransferase family 4 protein [Bacillus sp. FJAT-29790]
MNILLINHYAGSKYHGMEYRPYYLAREWVKLGHNVTIIAASYSHVRNVQPKIDQNWTAEIVDGIRYVWINTPSYEGNGLGRIKNMVTFVKSIYRYKTKILQEINPNVVIASSTYPLDIYPAKAIAKASKAKLIYEVHDLWPLSPKELGGMSRYHPFIMVMQQAENFAYKHCDLVVSLLPKAKGHMVEHGLDPVKFYYIPNGIDIDEWNSPLNKIPKEMSAFINEMKEKGQFLIGYAGAHGVANSLEILIESVNLLKVNPISLIMVGKGPEKINLKGLAKKYNLENIHFFEEIPKNTIPDFLSKMDVLYIGLQRQPLYRFGVSPNKLFDYMMSQKPVLHSIEAGNDLVAESKSGVSVEPENPQAIADGILKLMKLTEEERKQMGQNGYEYIISKHDYKKLAEHFISIMK